MNILGGYINKYINLQLGRASDPIWIRSLQSQILKVLLHSPGSHFFSISVWKFWITKQQQQNFKLINILHLLPKCMQTFPTLVGSVEVGFEWTVWLRFKFQWVNISKFTCRISQTEKFFHLVCQRTGSSGEPRRWGNVYWPLFGSCTVQLTACWRQCSVTWPD